MQEKADQTIFMFQKQLYIVKILILKYINLITTSNLILSQLLYFWERFLPFYFHSQFTHMLDFPSPMKMYYLAVLT